jgi:cobalt-zinc-cadmium efflux system membrane fusion protein
MNTQLNGQFLKRSNVRTVIGGITLLLALFSVSACKQAASDANAAKAPSAKAIADSSLVTLTAGMAKAIKTGQPNLADVATQLNVAGRVDVDEQRLIRIGSSVTGRVVEVLVSVGDYVTPGKVLARVTSPELTNAQLAYLRAASAATLAEKAVARAEQLISADVIGSAEQQRRNAEFQVAQAELNAAQDQLMMLGMSKTGIQTLRRNGDIQSSVPITSTRAGVVIERRVNVGQVVQPADQMFDVADLSAVWIVGGVPEQAAKSVALNQQVEVAVPALNKKVSGRIVFVSDIVDPDTRTVTVRTEVNNKDKALKPSMLANLHITGLSSQMLTVPSTAVVRELDKDHVFVQTANNQFKLTPVELGAEATGEVRPVIKGLDANQVIAIDGAFHLNNERKRAELE